jgi:threonylcarbamoyladenosine tRNA methylthiotransferase MtaB
VADVVADIRSALEGGAQEVVLTGVHLGSWGIDFTPPAHLSTLVSAILAETDTPRVRLSSLEPWDISPRFFELWQSPRLCRHLHLPLQSGCAATLKRMGRRITPEAYSSLVRQARLAIPGVAITTDIITGFPGETEAEFSESADFVKEMTFANGHVFTYSARPGTAAALLTDPVEKSVAKKRNASMRQVFHESSCAFSHGQLGQDLTVLWEKATPIDRHVWQMNGLTDNFVRLTAALPAPCCNQIMRVHVTGMKPGGLVGEVDPAYYQTLAA